MSVSQDPFEAEGTRPQPMMWYERPDRPLSTYSLPILDTLHISVTDYARRVAL